MSSLPRALLCLAVVSFLCFDVRRGLPSAPTHLACHRQAKVSPFLDEPVHAHVRAPSRALDVGVSQGRAADRFLSSALACTPCSQDQGRTFGRACVGAYLASRPQPGAYPGVPPRSSLPWPSHRHARALAHAREGMDAAFGWPNAHRGAEAQGLTLSAAPFLGMPGPIVRHRVRSPGAVAKLTVVAKPLALAYAWLH
jgi:hypothetical protein